MMFKKAKRIEKIPPYLFARIDKKKAEVSGRGVDIINLSIGDPDLPTPKHIVEAMHAAIDDAKNHDYPPYQGTLEFKTAVSNWYQKRFKVSLDPQDEIMALIGSKEGIVHAIFGIVDEGDLTLVPEPSYPPYKMGTLLAGGTPHFMPLKAENNFLPDLKAIDEEIAKKAKIIFINYPNNPTGAIANKSFFEELVAFAKKYQILIFSDLAYSEMAFDGYTPMSLLEIPGAKDVTIEFHSLSKTYNMTGWRIGMAAGSKEAIAALGIIKTNTDSGAFKAIQKAGTVALESSQDCVKEMQAVYTKRRDTLMKGLNELGWQISPIKATFYIFIPVPKGYTSETFVNYLLEETGILTVPGSGYGQAGEGYIRMAITQSEERIKEALERMKAKGIHYSE